MRFSTVAKAAALCVFAFASPFLVVGTSQFLVPFIVVQAFAAAFCLYHLIKYRPKNKIVVGAIFVSEASYILSYALVYLQSYGLLPDAAHAVATNVFNVGVAAMAVCALSMGAVRRPVHYQEGIIDFVAAVVVFAALEWELQGRGGHGAMIVATNFVLPLFCVLVFANAIQLTTNLFRDPRTNSLLVGGQILAVSLAGISNAGYAYYGESNTLGGSSPHTWMPALAITGGFLLSLSLVHRDSPALFQPELDFGKRLNIWRWLGPAAALATNPAMMALLLWKGFVPSLPLTLSSAALTIVVIWRIARLLKEREAALRKSELGEQRLQSLVKYAADVIVVTKDSGEITYVSPGVKDMVGTSVEETVGRKISSFVSEADFERVLAAMKGASTFSLDVALKTVDGSQRWATVTASDHRTDSSVEGWVWNVHDITDRKLSEETLSRLALYDQLTGLPNRTQMRDRLESLLRNETSRGGVAVLFCDLDGFKEVNDVLGHEAGDEVLRLVAGRWSAQLRANDILGRWGGDEFLMICEVTSDDSAITLADRLIASLSMPLLINGVEANVGASIGVVISSANESIDALLRRADAAMYVAKRGEVSLHIA